MDRLGYLWLVLQLGLGIWAIYTRSIVYLMFIVVVLVMGLRLNLHVGNKTNVVGCNHNSTYMNVNGECICSVCGKKVGGD